MKRRSFVALAVASFLPKLPVLSPPELLGLQSVTMQTPPTFVPYPNRYSWAKMGKRQIREEELKALESLHKDPAFMAVINKPMRILHA